MKLIIAPNFCLQCGTDDIEPADELCCVCQAAADETELRFMSQHEQSQQRQIEEHHRLIFT